MKASLLLFLLLFFFVKANGQEKVELYYNANWEITKKEKAVYTREAELDLEHFVFNGLVSDFDSAGVKVMEGNYTDGKRNGAFTFYFPNGKTEIKGCYQKNRRIGKWDYFYTKWT